MPFSMPFAETGDDFVIRDNRRFGMFAISSGVADMGRRVRDSAKYNRFHVLMSMRPFAPFKGSTEHCCSSPSRWCHHKGGRDRHQNIETRLYFAESRTRRHVGDAEEIANIPSADYRELPKSSPGSDKGIENGSDEFGGGKDFPFGPLNWFPPGIPRSCLTVK